METNDEPNGRNQIKEQQKEGEKLVNVANRGVTRQRCPIHANQFKDWWANIELATIPYEVTSCVSFDDSGTMFSLGFRSNSNLLPIRAVPAWKDIAEIRICEDEQERKASWTIKICNKLMLIETDQVAKWIVHSRSHFTITQQSVPIGTVYSEMNAWNLAKYDYPTMSPGDC